MPEPIDVVEALLFASEAPVEAERIQEVLDLASAGEARELVRVLTERLDGQGRALQIIEVGGGYRLVTRPEVAPWLVKLARSRTRSRLSRSSLETLAIVAYRQPASRPDIDAVGASTLKRFSTISSTAAWSASPGGRTRPAGRSSTRRRATSWSPSA